MTFSFSVELGCVYYSVPQASESHVYLNFANAKGDVNNHSSDV